MTISCKDIKFSKHAITRMFTRKLSKDHVMDVLENGEIIESYPDDQPYPSMLLLGFDNERPVHVVVAYDESTKTCILITAYIPGPSIWGPDFKRRRLL